MRSQTEPARAKGEPDRPQAEATKGRSKSKTKIIESEQNQIEKYVFEKIFRCVTLENTMLVTLEIQFSK